MGKNIAKVATLATIREEFLATMSGLSQQASAFERRMVLTGVNAVSALHAAVLTLPEDERVSIDVLHASLARDPKTGANPESVSKSTLDRWGRVSAIHAGITPSEGSASAVYAVTESGWTAARDAVKSAIESGQAVDADAIVDVVAASMNAHPRKVAAKKPAAVTAADVTDAPYSPEAFRASVAALLDRVPDENVADALKGLRALVNGYKREPVNA